MNVIKVKFVDKENLEETINEIKEENIKWITQNNNEYTIIYKYIDKNRKAKTMDKSVLGL